MDFSGAFPGASTIDINRSQNRPLVLVGVGEEPVLLKRLPILILALAIIVSLSGCFGGGGNSSSVKTFNVTGKVTSTTTRLGIDGATVTISDSKSSSYAYTGHDGIYQFQGVTTYDSTVKITGYKDGYEPKSKYMSITGGSNHICNLELDPKSSEDGGSILVKGWVDYGYNESYGQAASRRISPHRAWVEPDVMREPDSVIVELAGDVRTSSVSTLVRDVNAREYKVRELINRVIIKVPEGESLDDFTAKLRESPTVRSVEPNSIVYAAMVPDDEYYAQEQKWWLQLMNLPAAWEITTGDNQITIAVIDTGISYGHPDLPSQWEPAPGWDFVDRSPERPNGDNDPFDPGSSILPVVSHGSHVSGTIGALTNNGVGVAGVDWAV